MLNAIQVTITRHVDSTLENVRRHLSSDDADPEERDARIFAGIIYRGNGMLVARCGAQQSAIQGELRQYISSDEGFGSDALVAAALSGDLRTIIPNELIRAILKTALE